MLSYLYKRNENVGPQTNLYMNVHSNFVCQSKKPNCPLLGDCKNGFWSRALQFNGTSFSVTCRNMAGSQKHAGWKKSYIKEKIPYDSVTKRVWHPAACQSKVNKQARLVERKVRFISDAGNWGSAREQTSVQRQLATRGARDFIDWRRGLHVDPAQSALLVIFKFILDGLTSVISIVLGTVSLQFQGPFVPISLRPILELWQLVSWVQSGHHAVSFFTWYFSYL